MRTGILFLAWLSALASCTGGADDSKGYGKATATAQDTSLLIANHISRCARLTTTEYNMHKIIIFDDKVVVSGALFSHTFHKELPVGERKIAIPIDVTLRGYIDFANFGVENIKRHKGKITITLPDPVITVSASKIDHAHIRKSVDALRSDFSTKEIDEYTRQGIDSVIRHIPELGIIETARVSAARMLIPIVCKMGYSEQDIIINFRPVVNDRSILRWTDIERLTGSKNEM